MHTPAIDNDLSDHLTHQRLREPFSPGGLTGRRRHPIPPKARGAMKAISGLVSLISTTMLGMLTAANAVQGHALPAVFTGVAAVCTAIASVRWYRWAHREQTNPATPERESPAA